MISERSKIAKEAKRIFVGEKIKKIRNKEKLISCIFLQNTHFYKGRFI